MNLERKTVLPGDIEEMRAAHKVVELFSQAGYKYDQEVTHLDPENQIHFSKPLGRKRFPHFHLMFDPKTENFTAHIDKRKHRASHIEADLKDEMERIYILFSNQPPSIDPHTRTLVETLTKKALTVAMFGDNDEKYRASQKYYMHKNASTSRRKQKLRKKDRHSYLERKNRDKDLETGYIADWVPFDVELSYLGRQVDESKLE